ncbi:PmeII family type II restriction endonuclease [uncultured Adlercreutzia sp.]|uniref:PmeII family type II restriction endonuclease n=1 Tax=uncultured Adlercreutzia sp. TaxID=875803 RepID=UPI002600620C|nr:PmeII family type II restriction endonuclease [uncultured Adlercreutzia sp.]
MEEKMIVSSEAGVRVGFEALSGEAQEGVDVRRATAYRFLDEFAAKRTAYYRDPSKLNLKKLLAKDIIMFAARGVTSAEEFVTEAFHACESSSEETVIGNTWQAVVAAISSDTLDTGDMMTVRDGALYVCELKSQTNTTNSSSFPQELRELKDKCEAQRRFRRASNQEVRAAFCVLRDKKAVDEVRTYEPSERDMANRDIAGFQYRYLTGAAFWQWLTGYDSVEGLIDDVTLIHTGDVRAAREECLARLQEEMRAALAEHGLDGSMNSVVALKRLFF